MFAMAAPLPFRPDFNADMLRREAAKIGGVTLQIVRDWVVRFNAEGPAGLIDRKPPGSAPKLGAPKLGAAERQALAQMIERGPIPAVHGVVRWRLVDLAQWVREEFRISISTQTLSRELRALGYRKRSARPRHHAQDPQSLATSKKNFPAALAQVAAHEASGKPIEIWFADEMRVGQKNPITRRWARRGTRPSAPKDQRTASAYVFGAICPRLGKGAALVLPRCDTAAMNLHLKEIAATVAPGAHAVLLLDQAGWHTSAKLLVPPNITLMLLPPKAPELNPVENLWQFIRDNWLSNRIFQS
jgi:transposase